MMLFMIFLFEPPKVGCCWPGWASNFQSLTSSLSRRVQSNKELGPKLLTSKEIEKLLDKAQDLYEPVIILDKKMFQIVFSSYQ